jgi:hypothetical protein
MDVGAARGWLQHTHLEKLHGHLPGLADALPAVFGLDRSAYEAIRGEFAANARAAAASLLDDGDFAARVDALPFRSGQTILAVGDSNTDDLRSWAEILRYALAARRPESEVRLLNLG